jgi:hypothetical protein
MAPEDMIRKSAEFMESSHKCNYSYPEESVVNGLEANYWILRAIYEKRSPGDEPCLKKY